MFWKLGSKFKDNSTKSFGSNKFIDLAFILVNFLALCLMLDITCVSLIMYSCILFIFLKRLMEGSSYIWGFLVPACILLFAGFYLSAQGAGAVKLTAALQIDQRARNKIIKRRGLQIGLFFKVIVQL